MCQKGGAGKNNIALNEYFKVWKVQQERPHALQDRLKGAVKQQRRYPASTGLQNPIIVPQPFNRPSRTL